VSEDEDGNEAWGSCLEYTSKGVRKPPPPVAYLGSDAALISLWATTNRGSN